jgi:hypothetical protein
LAGGDSGNGSGGMDSNIAGGGGGNGP